MPQPLPQGEDWFHARRTAYAGLASVLRGPEGADEIRSAPGNQSVLAKYNQVVKAANPFTKYLSLMLGKQKNRDLVKGSFAREQGEKIIADEVEGYVQYSEFDREFVKKEGDWWTRWPTSMLLHDLGEAIEQIFHQKNVSFSLGPLKGYERAIQKTLDENELDFVKLEDMYRATLLCKSQTEFAQVTNFLDIVLTDEYGMCVRPGRQKDKSSPAAKAKSDYMGYGDMTYFINFIETRQPCELQVNMVGMLWGKMSEIDWLKCGYGEVFPYASTAGATTFGVKYGGIGHKFYEVYRTKKTGTEAETAQRLSKLYYGACTGDPINADQIREIKAWADQHKH